MYHSLHYVVICVISTMPRFLSAALMVFLALVSFCRAAWCGLGRFMLSERQGVCELSAISSLVL